MSTTTAEINDSAIIRDLWQLLKPKIMLLVVVTAIAAMLISPVYNLAHPIQLVLTILAIALGSGGASAFNMWYDRDIDKIMSRTKQRPIPSGRINSDEALAFSLISISASIILMFIASNTKATWMLLFSIFYYTVIYTILLKRHTVQNIVIGGASGSLPPVIGWLALGGDLWAPEPWLMFLIILLWNPPHFWALCLFRNADYKAVKLPMMPLVKGERHTKIQMVVYTLALFASCMLLGRYLGNVYNVIAIVINLMFLWLNVALFRARDNKLAPKLFGYSILYLFALFGAVMLDVLVANVVNHYAIGFLPN